MNLNFDLNKPIYAENGERVNILWTDGECFLGKIPGYSSPILYGQNNNGYPLTNHSNNEFARLKKQIVWKLPDPPKGKEWLRKEDFTEEMLPKGYRPLLSEELLQEGDEFQLWSKNGWMKMYNTYLGKPACPGDICRTQRPLPVWKMPEPLKGEKWYEASKFFEKDLEAGERPLLVGEKVHPGDKFLINERWENTGSAGIITGTPKTRGCVYKTNRPLPKREYFFVY